MPLYEYRCSECNHVFELIQKHNDAPPSTCPECKGAVEKLVSSPAFQFKGTGWYVTDYARKGKGPKEGEGKGEGKADTAKKDAKSEGTKSAKSDPKPAAKSEAVKKK